MKQIKPLRKVLLAAAITAAVLTFAGSALALDLNWAGPGGTTASPTSGIWDTNTPNWNAGVAFTNSLNGAVFGGAGNVGIQITNSFATTNITFNSSGYILTNLGGPVSTITINTANRGINVATGQTATLGTNVTIASSQNPFTFNSGAVFGGTLIIDNGANYVQTANQGFNFEGAPGSTIRVLTGGTIQHSGNGSNIRIPNAANAAPEIRIEGGRFITAGGTSFGSIILAAANSSTGTVTIVSGVLSNAYTGNAANGSLNMGNGSPGLGIMNLNGGTLALGNIRKTTAATIGVFNFNGGRLQAAASGAAPAFLPLLAGLTANVRTNTSTIDNNGFSMGIAHPLVHSTISGDAATDGGLAFIGPGTTTLSGTNTYTGPTFILNGTLNLGVPGSRINSSSLIDVDANATLVLSNNLVNTSGTFAMTNGTVQLQIFSFPTNITAGTLALGGAANTINIPIIVGGGVIPQATPLIKYTTLAPGAVDGNNVLTTLSLGALPPGFTGYLTNNVTKSSIDLVLMSGSLAPFIATQPVSISRYPGASVQFTATAFGVIGTQWRTNGVPIGDGGNVSGTTTSVLTITNLTAANARSYDVVFTNLSGSSISSAATLTVVTPIANYEALVASNNPVAYYRLNETGDPVNTPNLPAYDYAGGYDGVYGANVLNGFNGIFGPQPADGYPGFENGNAAVQVFHGYANSQVTVASLPINTNTVTLSAWIHPTDGQNDFNGVIFSRGANVAGMNYTASTNSNGEHTLGYTWNGDANSYNWNSGLVPPVNQWSLVALVVTPTNATIYVATTNGVASAVHTMTHVVQNFNQTNVMGNDPFGVNGARTFNGIIDEVAVFGRALSSAQITAMLTAASGLTNFPPVITVQPAANQTLYEQQAAQFSVQVSGTAPLSYRWQVGTNGVYEDLTDGGRISGSQAAILTVSNLALTDPTNYIVIITNLVGSVTSSVAALTIQPVGPPTNITTSVIQGSGSNWDTDGIWSLPGSASLLAVQYPGSTNIVLAPGGLRTPDFNSPNSPTSSSFPGDVLRVEGNGTYDTSLTAAGAIRIKGGNPSTVYFKKLQMAGGQICSILNSGWPAILTGEVNVISNTVVWASDDTSPRAITIQALLTGNGNITYHAYTTFTTLQTGSSASLNITNVNNTYTGTWNADLGSLVGSAPNALGTNAITVGAQGALQTTYDINNPNSDLVLNGRFYLTQNDTFHAATISGTGLPAGTHTFAELNGSFPANFPATWTGLVGATGSTTGSGSITVLTGPAATASYPTNITTTVSGGVLTLAWPATHLGWYAQSNSVSLANTNFWFDIAGSQSVTNLNITLNPGLTNVFYRLRHP
ncbi:MAG TPA: LamG-like jellyroll fold domain-containing protein [Verrucomicrobiae bacterium]|nr:LamG-like jellyroll fold domain-containing protein [Verrucomicrobiae bacterium]